MAVQIAAQNGEYVSRKTLHFSRNQDEAGIAHLQWETRIKPLRPMSYDIALGLGVVASIAVARLFV